MIHLQQKNFFILFYIHLLFFLQNVEYQSFNLTTFRIAQTRVRDIFLCLEQVIGGSPTPSNPFKFKSQPRSSMLTINRLLELNIIFCSHRIFSLPFTYMILFWRIGSSVLRNSSTLMYPSSHCNP